MRNIADAVLGYMKIGVYYRPCDIALPGKKVEASEVKRVLDLLAKGGIVEEIPGGGYRRKSL